MPANRIAVITHSPYPMEPRARRMAEALAGRGYAVDVYCLRWPGEQAKDVVNGVTIHRLPVTRHWGAPRLVYIIEYLLFFLLAGLRLNLGGRYALVQVHNPPDFLAWIARLPRFFRGSRVLYDVRDLSPELLMSRFRVRPDHLLTRLLRGQERGACRHADAVTVCTTHAFDVLATRGVAPEKMTIVMNCPDDRFFGAAAGPVEKQPGFSLVYHGTIPYRYGIDLIVAALPRLRREISGVRLDVYGSGDYQPTVEALAADLGVNDITRFHGYLPIETMPAAIRTADIGVVPMRQDIFTDCGLPTKLLEYAALGVPAVSSRTVTTTEYFDDSMVQYFKPGDADDLAAAVLALYRDPARAATLAANARRFTAAHNWPHYREVYLALVERLIGAPQAKWR